MMSDHGLKLRQFPMRTPSYKRYRYLSEKLGGISLTRSLLYEVLESYPTLGNVLDYGGGTKSHYRKLLKCESYQSINIDSKIQPTWLIEVGAVIPCVENSFDTVISLNTLEHVFEARSVIGELHRVLRPGGELILSVPFLLPIHGHPDDFFRPTPSWYRHALGASGFRVIEVIPLSWGPFSTGLVCSGLPGPGKRARMRWAMMKDLMYFQLRVRNRSVTDIQELFERFSTAFFVRAIK
jgi:SAM-dependent methyltransferase